MASGTLKAQEWESADDTTQTERARMRKSDYEVKVRSGHGEWRTAWTVGALVSNIDLRGNDEIAAVTKTEHEDEEETEAVEPVETPTDGVTEAPEPVEGPTEENLEQ